MEENPLISAIIITKNEEKNIARCLNSIVSLADEIIIIDSHSTDRTEQICASYDKLSFHCTDWKGYSETKNYGNSLAKGEYILSIDADEVISDELMQSLKNFAAESNRAEACSFNRLTNFCGKWIRHCGWYPDKKIRLWRKDLAHWKGKVHEKPVFTRTVTIGHLKGDLLHYSYHSVEEFRNHTRKYSDLASREIAEKGVRFLLLRSFISPLSRFITGYFFRGGFLDGYYGFLICRISAEGVHRKYKDSYRIKKLKDQSRR